MYTFIDIVSRHRDALLRGIVVTIELAAIVWFSGLLIGTLVGVISSTFPSTLRRFLKLSSFFLAGVPLLVFLFWAHYPFQAILGVVIDPFVTSALVLSTINVFAVADLVETQLSDFPRQYKVAAQVCGLSSLSIIFRIQIPIIMRQLIPALIPMQVAMLHGTLFASLISVEEIFRVSQRINAVEYKPVHIYTALAILFLAVSLPVNGLAIWLRSRFTRNVSEI